jgi:hypothetical protein
MLWVMKATYGKGESDSIPDRVIRVLSSLQLAADRQYSYIYLSSDG